MKTFEFIRNGSNAIYKGTMQGKVIRRVNDDNTLADYAYRANEVEILSPITEEFLSKYTEVYTSHGNWGWIMNSQYRDEKGILHPAQVFILNEGKPNKCSVVPIWENQLVKAIR